MTEIKNTIWNELLTDTSTTFSGDIFSDTVGYVISQDFIEKVEIEESEEFNITLHYTTKTFQEYFEECLEEFMWKVEREEIEEITEDYIRSFVLNYGEEFIFCDFEFISKTFDFDVEKFGLVKIL